MDAPCREMLQSLSCSMKLEAEAGKNTCCANPDQIRIPNTAEVIPAQAARNEGENEAMQEGSENGENGNQQHNVEVR